MFLSSRIGILFFVLNKGQDFFTWIEVPKGIKYVNEVLEYV